MAGKFCLPSMPLPCLLPGRAGYGSGPEEVFTACLTTHQERLVSKQALPLVPLEELP